jgi:hypothetical protein
VTLPAPTSPPAATPDLWELALRHPHIDPDVLALALERQATYPPLDFRTRLLIRDSLRALRTVWGEERVTRWVADSPARATFAAIEQEDLGIEGFPSLASRIMSHGTPDDALQLLRELGSHIRRPARINIGGSMALMLGGRLTRRTEDIDVVDELPDVVRAERELLDGFIARYSLRLAHFQSHYLPTGWEARIKSLGRFGLLDVFLVDELDIAVGKLFSAREKDRDDLRVLARQIDKQAMTDRLRLAGQAHLAEPPLRQNAEKNWYIVYGDALPA